MGERIYRKNTVKGSRKGQKWPERTRTAALADLLVGNNICAVARRHGVPESTLRSWLAAARKKGPEEEKSVFEAARREALRALGQNASAAACRTVEYMQRRLEINERDSRLYEAARAELDRSAGLAEEEGPSLPGLEGLKAQERAGVAAQIASRHEPMTDFAVTNYARALVGITGRAGELLGDKDTGPRRVECVLKGEMAEYAK